MVMGKKFMVAIRTTLRLEVPVASAGKLLVDEHYVQHLVAMTNEMFATNFDRISRVTAAIRSFFERVEAQEAKDAEKERQRALKRQRGIEARARRAAEAATSSTGSTGSTGSTSSKSAGVVQGEDQEANSAISTQPFDLFE